MTGRPARGGGTGASTIAGADTTVGDDTTAGAGVGTTPSDPSTHPARVARALSPIANVLLSQALVLVMLFVAGMAIHDLRPAGPDAGSGATAWLPWVMVAAGIMGALLAATRLRAGSIDLLAALVGTLVGLVVAAGVVSDAPSLADRMDALEASVAVALTDLLVERVPSPELSPFVLTLSALAWTTGACAAISVGRHARASGAVVPVGLMLVVPAILAETRGQDGGQLLWLTIGVTAALLLTLRLNLERQRVRWVRRHVTGGRGVGRAFLGGGTTLVIVVTLGAVGLTGIMGSSPLAAGWERLGSVLGEMGVDVGQFRGPATSLRGEFPDTMRLQNRWEPAARTYFTVSAPDGATYWRGAAYDRYDGRAWHRSESVRVDVAAGDDVLDATDDVVTTDSDGFRDVEATFTFQDMGGRDLVAPQNPFEVDRDTSVLTMGDGGPFQVLQARTGLSSGDHYRVMASEPDLDAGSPTVLTEALLRAAADETDPDWVDRFLQLPERVGQTTEDTASAIRRGLPRRARGDRYQLAHAVQRFLASAPFQYSTEFGAACRPGQTPTDCLLETRAGFCEQYATTMAVLLRRLHVPARWVVGYLPGEEVRPGEYVVGGAAAHAWVEVWFDGFGWVRFDPTPGTSPAADALAANGQRPTELPEGEAPTDPDPGPEETLGPDETFGAEETLGPDETEAPSPAPSETAGMGAAGGVSGPLVPPAALLVGGVIALLLALSLLALLWYRRLPAGGAQRAWGGIIGIATRFGRGPMPSQTPYEYSVTLSRVVPRVAQDIRTVADAKVMATYGPDHDDPATSTSSSALRAAYARARTGLLALWFRRRR